MDFANRCFRLSRHSVFRVGIEIVLAVSEPKKSRSTEVAGYKQGRHIVYPSWHINLWNGTEALMLSQHEGGTVPDSTTYLSAKSSSGYSLNRRTERKNSKREENSVANLVDYCKGNSRNEKCHNSLETSHGPAYC